MPINYQEGKIYKIYNTINDDIYVGSTSLKLCERMRDHRRATNSIKKKDRPLYQAFREHGIEYFFIELIEKCPCNDKDKLRKKEGEYIRSLKPSMNIQIPGRTDHEYYIDNKDKFLQDCKDRYVKNRSYILERDKKYRDNNKDKIKQYREDNKDKLSENNKLYKNEKLTCECGCVMNRSSMLRHQRSKKHNELINKLN